MSIKAGIAASVGLAIALGFSHWLAYEHGIETENADRRAEVAELVREQGQRIGEINSQHSKALAFEMQRQADQQAQHAADMAALDSKFTKEMQDEKRKAEADVAAVRAGAIRVRDKFACPAGGSASGASGAGTQAGRTPSLGDAAPAGGLQTADVELVLRIGAEADEVTKQLQACQEIVKRDRGN